MARSSSSHWSREWCGPQIWAMVSTSLFKIICQERFLATIICAMSLQQQTMEGFAFVDDMDFIVTDSMNEIQAVTNKMQGSLKLWHGLLKATGGDLDPEKCSWYLINFNFANNHWQYLHWYWNQWPLQIPNEGGIPLFQFYEAQKTLGVWLAPDGNNDKE